MDEYSTIPNGLPVVMCVASAEQSRRKITISHSQIDSVVKYIKNQEQHHKRKTFREEYIEFLRRFNISFISLV